MRRLLALLPLALALAACGGGPAGDGGTGGNGPMQTPAGQTTTKDPGY